MKKTLLVISTIFALASCQCLPPKIIEQASGHSLQSCELKIQVDKAGHIQSIQHKDESISGLNEDIFLFQNGTSLANKLKLSPPLLDETSINYAYKIPKTRLKITRAYESSEEAITARYYFKNRSSQPIQLKWFHTFKNVEKIDDKTFLLRFAKKDYLLEFTSKNLELKEMKNGFESHLMEIAPNHRISWKIHLKTKKEK